MIVTWRGERKITHVYRIEEKGEANQWAEEELNKWRRKKKGVEKMNGREEERLSHEKKQWHFDLSLLWTLMHLLPTFPPDKVIVSQRVEDSSSIVQALLETSAPPSIHHLIFTTLWPLALVLAKSLTRFRVHGGVVSLQMRHFRLWCGPECSYHVMLWRPKPDQGQRVWRQSPDQEHRIWRLGPDQDQTVCRPRLDQD